MRKILFLFLFFCVNQMTAQEAVLLQIEENNTLLSSLRHQADAEKISNKTGIYLENPEVEYGYAWGNSRETGNKIDFSVMQNFDFPTAYHHLKKLTDSQNEQVDLKYRIERKNILLEAQTIYIQLIYQNALSEQLKRQYDLTTQIAEAYQKRFDKGDANALDVNKAQFDLLNAKKDYYASLIDEDYFLMELQRLNGGKAIIFTEKQFPKDFLPSDFEQWYAEQMKKNLFLESYQREIKISKTNEKLQRSKNLPKFMAGYATEKVLTEQFQGVVVGVSIPLWENKNTIKQIKAQTLAFEQSKYDADMQNYSQTKALYRKAVSLKEIIDDFERFQVSDNTIILLQKALDAGEISLIDFITELGIYYDLVESRLEIEKDFYITLAELKQWEL